MMRPTRNTGKVDVDVELEYCHRVDSMVSRFVEVPHNATACVDVTQW